MTKTETVAIKVTPEEKELIKQLAATEDVTVSKLLYRILIKEIFNNGNSSKLGNSKD
jgi:uncharacterized protein (DUF1778 family)